MQHVQHGCDILLTLLQSIRPGEDIIDGRNCAVIQPHQCYLHVHDVLEMGGSILKAVGHMAVCHQTLPHPVAGLGLVPFYDMNVEFPDAGPASRALQLCRLKNLLWSLHAMLVVRRVSVDGKVLLCHAMLVPEPSVEVVLGCDDRVDGSMCRPLEFIHHACVDELLRFALMISCCTGLHRQGSFTIALLVSSSSTKGFMTLL